MLSKLRNFLYRHKKKIIVSGIIIGGAILAKNYTYKKLIEWQEQEAKEFLEFTRREQYFRYTERTCNNTICSLGETLKESILKIIDADDLLIKIRNGEGNKILLWDDLKVQVFAQLSSFLYSGLMLVIFLRIQLNVIGGHMFRSKIDTQSHDGFKLAFQEHYLSLCQSFLNEGVKDVCTIIETHCQKVLATISLKKKMSLQDIENIFRCIQASISKDAKDPLKNLSNYLVPPSSKRNPYQGVDFEKMNVIVDETLEILESEEVKSIADSCIKRAYSNVVDKIAANYCSMTTLQINSTKKDGNDFTNVTKISIPLAKIVPVIHGLYKKSVDNNEVFSSWIHQFLIMDSINNLGANLYEAFSSST